jgi:hypothetical protein
MAQGLQAFHGEQGAALNTTECNDPAEHGRKAPNKLRNPVLLFQRDRKRTRGTDHLARINTMATDQIITAGEKRYGCKHSGIHISPNGTVWLQFGPFSVREQWLIEQTTPKA